MCACKHMSCTTHKVSLYFIYHKCHYPLHKKKFKLEVNVQTVNGFVRSPHMLLCNHIYVRHI